MNYYAYRTNQSAAGAYRVEEESWFQEVKEGNGKPFIIGVHEEKAVAMKWDVLSVARGILDPDTGKYLGMIVIDCSVDNFAKLWDASEYSESIIAVSDKNGKLILPGGEENKGSITDFLEKNSEKFKEKGKLYQVYFGNQTYYLAMTKLNYMDGKIYQLVPIGDAVRNIAYTFYIGGCCNCWLWVFFWYL